MSATNLPQGTRFVAPPDNFEERETLVKGNVEGAGVMEVGARGGLEAPD
jgi:hypothetical protein